MIFTTPIFITLTTTHCIVVDILLTGLYLNQTKLLGDMVIILFASLSKSFLSLYQFSQYPDC